MVPEVEVNVLIAPIAINLATLAIVAINYMDGLLALPMWPSPLILRCLSLRALLNSTKPLPTIREAFAEVKREESRKKLMLGKQTAAATTESSALAARGQSSNNGGNQ